MRNCSGTDGLDIAEIVFFAGLDTTVPVYYVSVHLTFLHTVLMMVIIADFACWAVTR